MNHRYKRLSTSIALLLILFISYSQAAEKTNWRLIEGGDASNSYRYAEQYGIHKDLLTESEDRFQRLDFTFSKRKGWQLYVTGNLVGDSNDEIILHIDDYSIRFENGGSFNKQAFALDPLIIDRLKNASSLSVEEIYYPDNSKETPWFHYKSYFKTDGLKDALNWVSNL